MTAMRSAYLGVIVGEMLPITTNTRPPISRIKVSRDPIQIHCCTQSLPNIKQPKEMSILLPQASIHALSRHHPLIPFSDWLVSILTKQMQWFVPLSRIVAELAAFEESLTSPFRVPLVIVPQMGSCSTKKKRKAKGWCRFSSTAAESQRIIDTTTSLIFQRLLVLFAMPPKVLRGFAKGRFRR